MDARGAPLRVAVIATALALLGVAPALAADQPDPAGSVLEGRLSGPNANGAYNVSAPYSGAVASRRTGRFDRGSVWCTASVIDSVKRTLLITAAHCLGEDDGSGYAISDEFRQEAAAGRATYTPAYDGREGAADPRPYGTWQVVGAYVLPGSRADVAILQTAPDASGRRIQDVVGGFDIHAPITSSDRVRATLIGYPGPEPFHGVAQSACVGDYTLHPGRGNGSLARVSDQEECWVGGGSSGGPYVAAPARPGGAPRVLTVLNSNGGADVPTLAPALLALADDPAAVPGAVRALRVKGRHAGPRRTIRWRPPDSDGGATITGYRVRVVCKVEGKRRTVVRRVVEADPQAAKVRTTVRRAKLGPGACRAVVRATNAVGSGPKAVARVRR